MALTKPFAVNGDKTPIKLDTTSDGVVNYENGFGARYSMPIKAVIDSSGNITKTGGLQIERAQMNQILNDFSSAIIENQENIGDLSSLQTTTKDNLVNAINEVNTTTPKLLTKNLTWDVANETQLREALNEALKLKKDNIVSAITLRMTADIVLKNPLTFTYVDCRNIIIDGQSEFKLQKNMSSIKDIVLYGLHSTFLPRFINLEISNTTATNQYGYGIVLYYNSNINLHNGNVTLKNLSVGLSIGGGCTVEARMISIDSCNIGVNSFYANVVDVIEANIKNCNLGISHTGGGVISANRVVFKNNTTNCNIPFNQVTANGIVFN